jgi:hypothetical protein
MLLQTQIFQQRQHEMQKQNEQQRQREMQPQRRPLMPSVSLTEHDLRP